MDKFSNQVLSYIREQALIGEGDRVTVGFSGGADSVCLLALLWRLRALLRIELSAVHVNHGLRGAEAERDEAFCRAFSEARGIPFASERVDVYGCMAERHLSEEEAARLLRYEMLRKYSGKGDGRKASALMKSGRPETAGSGRSVIAVAHHADDQAETILLNLVRGSGLLGLSGMQAEKDGVIRPLLCVTRTEILRWLEKEGLPYVEDSSNQSSDYARNRIRGRVLPLLNESLNGRASAHIVAAGALCGEADRFLRAAAEAWADAELRLEPFEAGKLRAVLPAKLKEKEQIFRRYVIIEALRRLKVPLKDWGEVHFADIDRLIGAEKGLHLDLPGGITAENAYKETALCRPA